MFERLTVPARQAIVAAHSVARATGRKAICAADLVAGCLQAEEAVAGDLLRANGLSAIESGAQTADATADDPEDLLRVVIAAAAGVATARGTQSIGTASMLLALIALAPPSLTTILDMAGVADDELAEAVRAADDGAESMAASSQSMSATGDAVWIVTIGRSDPGVAWDDGAE